MSDKEETVVVVEDPDAKDQPDEVEDKDVVRRDPVSPEVIRHLNGFR
ncbi:hypothetical protein [Sulfidibacter corallicola]|uniref:Uncharacterized protein n=1 Tax=Sulfidibacter corallicola TaxID=2818388 RepID=A0A8A4TIH4_SULCO|nr:hypothetical protein [Sulfidibacter corallicola]QTD48588.1 hypothetical protein J3U87_23655 [Sulfidibacter corallicola]